MMAPYNETISSHGLMSSVAMLVMSAGDNKG
jgi:hypothetical protein